MRVCLLSASYPPAEIGGIGRHTNLMARGLCEIGHEVHVIAQGNREQDLFDDGVHVHRISYRTNRYSRYSRFQGLFHGLNYSHAVYEKVAQLIYSDGIQVVDSPLWQLEGLVTAVSNIIPVIVWLQTSLRHIAVIQGRRDHDARLIGELERALIERADYLIPNSRATLDAVREVHNVMPKDKRYRIIPHGIVPVPDDQVRPFNRERESDGFVVLYVGRLEQRKGILDLFEAIPSVLERVSGVKFIVAGQDNSKHDGFQNKMGMDYPSYFAHRYERFMPHVEFMGKISEETLQSLYQSCDLFVAPSLYESFGLVYLEAMNYANPVIGCNVGGVPEVVDHGVTGLLVDPEAPAALAEAITSLLRSPTKLYEMGVTGRKRLLEKFTYLQMAQNYERVFQAVIRGRAVLKYF